jgi:hypothetical protein
LQIPRHQFAQCTSLFEYPGLTFIQIELQALCDAEQFLTVEEGRGTASK